MGGAVVSATKLPGVQMSHAERRARTGRVRVECYLDADVAEKLDTLAEREFAGSRTAVIAWLIRHSRRV